MTRELSEKEKKFILDSINDKGIKNDVSRVLDVITIPEDTDNSELKKIRDRFLVRMGEDLPRKLTEQELNDIVISSIPLTTCPVKKIGIHVTNQVRSRIKKQLSKQKYLIKDGTIDKIKSYIYESYIRAICDAGSSVGSMGGMAVASQITQAMLDAIHTSGTETTKEESFRLIKGYLEMRKEPDILRYTVHFKDKNLTAEEILVIGDILKGISVGEFILEKEILSEVPKDDWRHYNNHFTIYGEDESIKPENVNIRFLRLYIDINKCFMYNTTIEDLIEIIMNNTEDDDFDNTITCISSPLDRGFIDIHGNIDYIKYSVVKFSNLGKRIGDCSKISKDKEEEIIDSENLIKNITEMELDDMTGIFLKVIIGDCLSEMKIKGVSGIIDVTPQPTVLMDSTFTQTRVYSETEVEKFSNDPYNFDASQISRLWNIKVTKESIYFKGITVDKIRESFDVCGMKIVDDRLDNEYSCTIMMPSDRDDKFFDNDGNIRNVYEKIKGKWYNVKDKDREPEEINDQGYKPKIRMTSLRNFEQAKLSRKILEDRKNKDLDFYSILPEFSKIYRSTMYNYASVSGKDITRDLFSNKLVDHRYLFPENTRAVNRIFGIESARFYLIWKYMSVGFIEKVNPMTVILLVGLQTWSGSLIPIQSIEIYKRSDSVLSKLSFEKQNTIINEASAFGEEDNTTSVGSRIITGKPCLNGTGMVNIEYGEDYLNDLDNRYYLHKNDEGKTEALHTDDVLGGCLNSGVYVLPSEDINADYVDNPMLLSDSNKKPIVCNKEDLPSPPRTRAPESLSRKSSRKTSSYNGEKINIDNLEDIPDAPDFFDDEEFMGNL